MAGPYLNGAWLPLKLQKRLNLYRSGNLYHPGLNYILHLLKRKEQN